MPWEPVTVEEQRRELVKLAQQQHVPFREVCRRCGVTPKTGYKWRRRAAEEGLEGLRDRSRRPHRTQPEVPAPVQEAIVAWRQEHPCWGARKLRRLLQNQGYAPVPATSAITRVLHRHGLISPEAPAGQQAWQRFEHPAPNDLWQMDFKAPVKTLVGEVPILSVLDDHSRFLVGLEALPNKEGATVQAALQGLFRRYGIPTALLMDNGTPWGDLAAEEWSATSVWLMRLRIYVAHARPYHPQTVGKDERFHGTLERELLARRQWRDQSHLQEHLPPWRRVYNEVRPHEALQLEVPASRYRMSLRPFPEALAPILYPPGVEVRRVQDKGEVFFQGRVTRVSKAFRGYPVGLRPDRKEGSWEILFCQQVIHRFDLRECPKTR